MYAGPLFAIKLVQALRKREPWRQVITAVAFCLAPLVAYHVVHYLVFGELVPNTYYAKVGFGIDQYARGLLYSNTFMQEYGMWILLAAPVALLASTASIFLTPSSSTSPVRNTVQLVCITVCMRRRSSAVGAAPLA